MILKQNPGQITRWLHFNGTEFDLQIKHKCHELEWEIEDKNYLI